MYTNLEKLLYYTFDHSNINAHDCTDEECIEVILMTSYSFKMSSSRDGNDREMFVGKPAISETILEVGVEYMEDPLTNEEIEHIFHGMKARKANIKESGYVE